MLKQNLINTFKWLAIVLLTLGLAFAGYYYSPYGIVLRTGQNPNTEAKVLKLSSFYNPDSLKLENLYQDHVYFHKTDEDLIVGYVKLADGNRVQYWFRSHHVSDDMGGTLFKFPDGSDYWFPGYFCCEVDLPVAAVANEITLRKFLEEHRAQKDWDPPLLE